MHPPAAARAAQRQKQTEVRNGAATGHATTADTVSSQKNIQNRHRSERYPDLQAVSGRRAFPWASVKPKPR